MKNKKIYIWTAVLTVLIVFCVFAFDVRLKTVECQIDAPQIEGSIRIALVTDLHACDYGDDQSRLAEDNFATLLDEVQRVPL